MRAERALFEKLTDEDLDIDFEKVPKKFASLAELRDSIMENLELLLNTRVSLHWRDYVEDDAINDTFPFAYGINATGAIYTDNVFEMQELEARIAGVIRRFEPRLHDISVQMEVKENPKSVFANIDANVIVDDQKIALFFPVAMNNTN